MLLAYSAPGLALRKGYLAPRPAMNVHQSLFHCGIKSSSSRRLKKSERLAERAKKLEAIAYRISPPLSASALLPFILSFSLPLPATRLVSSQPPSPWHRSAHPLSAMRFAYRKRSKFRVESPLVSSLARLIIDKQPLTQAAKAAVVEASR